MSDERILAALSRWTLRRDTAADRQRRERTNLGHGEPSGLALAGGLALLLFFAPVLILRGLYRLAAAPFRPNDR